MVPAGDWLRTSSAALRAFAPPKARIALLIKQFSTEDIVELRTRRVHFSGFLYREAELRFTHYL
jgi:hypothetical protein